MPKATRLDVFTAIDTEREYQESLPPTRTDGRDRTVGDYITMLGHYQNELLAAWTKNPGDKQALEVMRKIGGIAVHCMEDHGAPRRKLTAGQTLRAMKMRKRARSAAARKAIPESA